MLQFYNNPMSNNARRVWIALLEKQIDFEPVEIKLDGDQFTPEFIEINPFHHIPVLIDDGFKVIESLAILDYLEAKYPTPALMPTDPQAIATVRMIQLVNVNELAPAIVTFMRHNLEIEVEAKK
ncbi:MAG: glutathione S-transferase family protein [Moorea sp. SIO3E2]|nr:glutathione S-transferase family protein [Moorena sp. SIO3E2]